MEEKKIIFTRKYILEKKIPWIQTERTTLTVLPPEQARFIYEYYRQNKEHLSIWEPQRDEEDYTLEAWKERVEETYSNFQKGISVHFAALSLDQSEMVGVCNFNNIVHGIFQACYLGYSIGKKYEGSGLMFEIVSRGIAYMFDEVGLHRIMANHIPQNKRSEKLLARLGFEREGYAKSYLKIAGSWQDHVLNSLINPKDEKHSL